MSRCTTIFDRVEVLSSRDLLNFRFVRSTFLSDFTTLFTLPASIENLNVAIVLTRRRRSMSFCFRDIPPAFLWTPTSTLLSAFPHRVRPPPPPIRAILGLHAHWPNHSLTCRTPLRTSEKRGANPFSQFTNPLKRFVFTGNALRVWQLLIGTVAVGRINTL
uniref:Uncharacterized protein n=1 Tax=Steinernema glaseri TaxID=37863 RepID=A0A1I8AAC5_9BILA